jgi:hypothetical protein
MSTQKRRRSTRKKTSPSSATEKPKKPKKTAGISKKKRKTPNKEQEIIDISEESGTNKVIGETKERDSPIEEENQRENLIEEADRLYGLGIKALIQLRTIFAKRVVIESKLGDIKEWYKLHLLRQLEKYKTDRAINEELVKEITAAEKQLQYGEKQKIEEGGEGIDRGKTGGGVKQHGGKRKRRKTGTYSR